MMNYLEFKSKPLQSESCRVHPRAGIIPGGGKDGLPRIVMTMNSLDLSGSDVFRGMYGLETDDLGRTWTSPQEPDTLEPQYEVIDGVKRPVAVSDFWFRNVVQGLVILE